MILRDLVAFSLSCSSAVKKAGALSALTEGISDAPADVLDCLLDLVDARESAAALRTRAEELLARGAASSITAVGVDDPRYPTSLRTLVDAPRRALGRWGGACLGGPCRGGGRLPCCVAVWAGGRRTARIRPGGRRGDCRERTCAGLRRCRPSRGPRRPRTDSRRRRLRARHLLPGRACAAASRDRRGGRCRERASARHSAVATSFSATESPHQRSVPCRHRGRGLGEERIAHYGRLCPQPRPGRHGRARDSPWRAA